jgi:hypothetical protein
MTFKHQAQNCAVQNNEGSGHVKTGKAQSVADYTGILHTFFAHVNFRQRKKNKLLMKSVFCITLDKGIQFYNLHSVM